MQIILSLTNFDSEIKLWTLKKMSNRQKPIRRQAKVLSYVSCHLGRTFIEITKWNLSFLPLRIQSGSPEALTEPPTRL